MRAVRLFVGLVDRLSTIIGWVVAVLVPAMPIVILYEVISRAVFGLPTVWAFDTSVFLFGYTGLLAGAYVHRRRQHISVDILYVKLSPRGRAVVDLLTELLVIFFLTLVVIYGWRAAESAIRLGTRRPSEWGPPIGHFMLMIPVGAGLLILQSVAHWLRCLHLALTGRPLEPAKAPAA
jgi:TRAP-type mannitol/chloroaromatic compound transport system permease small subunit